MKTVRINEETVGIKRTGNSYKYSKEICDSEASLIVEVSCTFLKPIHVKEIIGTGVGIIFDDNIIVEDDIIVTKDIVFRDDVKVKGDINVSGCVDFHGEDSAVMGDIKGFKRLGVWSDNKLKVGGKVHKGEIVPSKFPIEMVKV